MGNQEAHDALSNWASERGIFWSHLDILIHIAKSLETISEKISDISANNSMPNNIVDEGSKEFEGSRPNAAGYAMLLGVTIGFYTQLTEILDKEQDQFKKAQKLRNLAKISEKMANEYQKTLDELRKEREILDELRKEREAVDELRKERESGK